MTCFIILCQDDKNCLFFFFFWIFDLFIMNSWKQEKTYSIEELQSMFWNMAQSFEIPEWSSSLQQPMYDTQCFGGPFGLYESRTMTTNYCQSNMIGGDEHLSKSGFETYVTHYFFWWAEIEPSNSSLDQRGDGDGDDEETIFFTWSPARSDDIWNWTPSKL